MSPDSDMKWIFGIFLTGLVAWWFRNREAKKATHLKDLRSKIDAICSELDAIEDLVPDYFLQTEEAESLPMIGLRIRAKLIRIANTVNIVYRITGYSDWMVGARHRLRSVNSPHSSSTPPYVSHGEKALTTLEKIRGSITPDMADIEEKRKLMSQTLLTCLKNFRQAVTLNNFDISNRIALKSDDAQFERIFAASSRLKNALEAIYESEKRM